MKPRVYLKAGFWEQLSQMKGLDAISAMVHLADSLAESNVCTDISEKYINKEEGFSKTKGIIKDVTSIRF